MNKDEEELRSTWRRVALWDLVDLLAKLGLKSAGRVKTSHIMKLAARKRLK